MVRVGLHYIVLHNTRYYGLTVLHLETEFAVFNRFCRTLTAHGSPLHPLSIRQRTDHTFSQEYLCRTGLNRYKPENAAYNASIVERRQQRIRPPNNGTIRCSFRYLDLHVSPPKRRADENLAASGVLGDITCVVPASSSSIGGCGNVSSFTSSIKCERSPTHRALTHAHTHTHTCRYRVLTVSL